MAETRIVLQKQNKKLPSEQQILQTYTNKNN
jgi:hypothetical protein